MDEPHYQVVLEGRKVGPYDRRTIVGMRIKNALSAEHELIAADGTRLTVGDLLNAGQKGNQFQPNRSGSYSLVQATYAAAVAEREGAAREALPAFKGEIQARVQSDVLRIAGRFRDGLGWREDRVKIPLQDIVHARVRGTLVDLWLRGTLAKFTLDLLTHEAAGEFVEWLPAATPWPDTAARRKPQGGGHPLVWVAIVGAALMVGGVVVLVLARAGL